MDYASLKANRCLPTTCWRFCPLAGRTTAAPPLSAGKHTITFDLKTMDPVSRSPGTGVLKVDGNEVHTLSLPKTIPFLVPADESFDVGVDTRTGVNDLDYHQVPFGFDGKIAKLTFNLGPTQLTEDERKKVGTAIAARAHD